MCMCKTKMFWHKANIQGANYEEVIYLLQVMDELSGLPHSSTMCVRAMKPKDLNEHVEITVLILVSPQDRPPVSPYIPTGGKR